MSEITPKQMDKEQLKDFINMYEQKRADTISEAASSLSAPENIQERKTKYEYRQADVKSFCDRVLNNEGFGFAEDITQNVDFRKDMATSLNDYYTLSYNSGVVNAKRELLDLDIRYRGRPNFLNQRDKYGLPNSNNPIVAHCYRDMTENEAIAFNDLLKDVFEKAQQDAKMDLMSKSGLARIAGPEDKKYFEAKAELELRSRLPMRRQFQQANERAHENVDQQRVRAIRGLATTISNTNAYSNNYGSLKKTDLLQGLNEYFKGAPTSEIYKTTASIVKRVKDSGDDYFSPNVKRMLDYIVQQQIKR
ncbi:MAG: hypothetical protein LBL34_01525 [Clostridiales bacterium]|jgi:hypothetical protein|nr:hypothetical protein [Clostridiales bacterium]